MSRISTLATSLTSFSPWTLARGRILSVLGNYSTFADPLLVFAGWMLTMLSTTTSSGLIPCLALWRECLEITTRVCSSTLLQPGIILIPFNTNLHLNFLNRRNQQRAGGPMQPMPAQQQQPRPSHSDTGYMDRVF